VITMLVMAGLLITVAVVLLVAERILISYGECSVTINDKQCIQVEGGETLLSVLNRHKLFVPSACGGKATCGFCKVVVRGGAGAILPTEEIFINKAEREQGMRLACQVKVERPVRVQMPETLLGAREYTSEVQAVEQLTYDTRLIRFGLKGGDEVRFKPGQYVQLLVPGTDQFRAYSVASPPSRARRAEGQSPESRVQSPELELIIRRVPGGLCTGWIHSAVEKGDEVRFTGPFGDFYLHEDSDREIVAIGGGSGMAPMRSIILHLAEQGMPRKVTLFFGARRRRDLFYVEEFQALERQFPNFRYLPALSEPRPEDNWTGETGFITQTVQKHIVPGGVREAVLCGPPPMIDAAMRVLPRIGIPAEHTYFDKF
jgi:Na+-transporting NADH:ubiquinone oxidoreductase subunit F